MPLLWLKEEQLTSRSAPVVASCLPRSQAPRVLFAYWHTFRKCPPRVTQKAANKFVTFYQQREGNPEKLA